MAQKGHHSNLSLLNMAWASSDGAVNEPAAGDAQQPPPNTKQPTIQIQVTAPDGTQSGLTVGTNANGNNADAANGQAPGTGQAEEEKKSKVSVPTLAESSAFDTLLLFHQMGLGGGDSEDLFGAVPTARNGADALTTPSQTDTETQSQTQMDSQAQKQIFNMDQLAMSGILPAVTEDNPISPVLDTSQIMGNGVDAAEVGNGLFVPQTNVLETGLQPQAIRGVDPSSNAFEPPLNPQSLDPSPKPTSSGKGKAGRKSPGNNYAKNDALSAMLQKNEARILNQFEQNGGGSHQKLTPRKAHDVKDMDDYKEITSTDLQQFEEMLANTEKLIDDMIEVCNYNGYGLNVNMNGNLNEEMNEHKDEQDEIHFSQADEMKIKQDALERNITSYNIYLTEQLQQFNFHLSSNAIVDLMGVKPTYLFDTNLNRFPSDIVISHQGYVLYKNKRLTSHYFFVVLDERRRRDIDREFSGLMRDYLRYGHFNMQYYHFPTEDSLIGLSPHLIDHFAEQSRVFYQYPGKIRHLQMNGHFDEFGAHEIMDPRWRHRLTVLQQQDPTLKQDNFCVIVFPNHKAHFGRMQASALWSRSVSYFDNIGRGTALPFIEQCCSLNDDGNGWGILLMNPNTRTCESLDFRTKEKYDEPPSAKRTETVTVPRNESSYAHTTELWKRFILPHIINDWKCKLLLISHCDGGNDIVHLLESQPNSHKHIIGIAMLDFYNWSLSEFSKKTRQVIEQKAAIYMSLYGSNESAYGLEPSAAKSPVTIFRTANKEKRYSPCYNMESVIRFFKSKIELNKIK